MECKIIRVRRKAYLSFQNLGSRTVVQDIIQHNSDILVIGGGASGSVAAIRARDFGVDVLLVDKSVFGVSGCAALASGDIRLYFPGDDMEVHYRGREDLANYKIAIRQLKDSYEVFKHLIEWGVPFVTENGEFWRHESQGGGFDVALQGGGPKMMRAIRREALKRGVKVVNRVMINDILTSAEGHPKSAVGAIGFEVRTGALHLFHSKAVIVCAGGHSIPYQSMGAPFSGMPIDLSGDGIAAEIRAGAVMGDMSIGAKQSQPLEFLCAPGIEHLSAQGARWVNGLGENFLEKYADTERDLTRRQVQNAAMEIEVREGRGPIYLDCRHFRPDQIRFLWDVIPIIMSNFERAGYDISKDLVPYVQSIATTQGKNTPAGAAIDEECRTSIPGLYAAGASSDCVRVKPHIALGECLTTGWWAGEHAAKFALVTSRGELDEKQIDACSQRIMVPLHVQNGVQFNQIHKRFEDIVQGIGAILAENKIENALKSLADLWRESEQLSAKDPHYLAKILSLKNAIFVETFVLKFLQHRKESRLSVLNEDYPEVDNINWLNWSKGVLKEDGSFEIWDEEIPVEVRRPDKEPKIAKRLHPMFKVLAKHGICGNSS
ncbi:MAG: FAD-binding protein [Nitrososphaerota archaeon]|nr:FAD-binding protein [Nitrososphaerota archaeon]